MGNTLRLILIALGASVMLGGPIVAADPPEDPDLSRSAYSLLQNDPQLGPLNLGVRVFTNGHAVLWGPAPSAETIVAARTQLLRIRGIRQVVSECTVSVARDPFLIKVEDAVRRPPPPAVADAPSETLPIQPTAARVPLPDERRRTELLPIGVTGPDRDPHARLLEPMGEDQPPIDSRFERLRRSDLRYADLAVTVHRDRVVIMSSRRHAPSAWDLADRYQTIAGERVVLVRFSDR